MEPTPKARISIERLTAFTDAVVAIAMTLLVLPLMEAVPEAARSGASTAEFFTENAGLWFGFACSFFVIATMWFSHHGLFGHVEWFHPVLYWLDVLWMFTIVLLSLATAIMGSMRTDPAQMVLYIGTMAASSAVLVVSYRFVDTHPELWGRTGRPNVGGQAAAIAQLGLTLLVLVLCLVLPFSYLPLFLLAGIQPLSRVIAPRLRRGEAAS